MLFPSFPIRSHISPLRFAYNCLLLAGLSQLALAAPKITKQVTFHSDVAPILQRSCQGCHRPGEAAPMSLLTYKEVRPFAKAIGEVVRSRRMPPWSADAHVGKFRNDPSLTAQQIETVTAWVAQGAKEGDPSQSPAPVPFVTGWGIGKPDLIVEMPKPYTVPATGTIEYTHFVLPLNNKEPLWVTKAEVRPSNRAVVHHVIAFIRTPENRWMRNAVPGEPYTPQMVTDRRGKQAKESIFGGQWLVSYAPGTPPVELRPGQARLIPPGSDVIIQMHYTPNGKAQADQTKVGLTFSKEPPKERIYTLVADNNRFEIPPYAASHAVEGEFTVQTDVKLTSLMPHMHLRGKRFKFQAVYPDGKVEPLLDVPNYDFNWQMIYFPVEDKLLPAGTRIQCTGVFDNSPNNKANPDPTKPVRFGEQSWEEMMIGFFDVAISPTTPISDIFRARRVTAGN